jgi:probable F420-dependent oxidoreductase
VRFSLALPVGRRDLDAEFTSPEAIAEMARAVEQAGFDACHVTDHPFPTKAWLDAGGHHSLDPFVVLAIVGAHTSRLRLHTNAYIPAYRNPFVAAKSAATLDALTGGRLILGVAVGYLEGEFDAVGAPFQARGQLLDGAIELMLAAWRGEPLYAEGRGWKADGNVALPRPASSPHPPLWIGGNAPAAMRRAVRLGDGWMPFAAGKRAARAVRSAPIADHDDLRLAIEALRRTAGQAGRTRPLDVCFTPFSHSHWHDNCDPPALVRECESLAEMGVTWAAFHLPAPSRASWLDNVARFGEEAIAKLRDRD